MRPKLMKLLGYLEGAYYTMESQILISDQSIVNAEIRKRP